MGEAIILIGYRTKFYSGDSLGAASPQLVFNIFNKNNLTLDKGYYAKVCMPGKTIYGGFWHDEAGFDFSNGFLDLCLKDCRIYAEEFYEWMKKEDLRKYQIINGKRVRHTDLTIVDCEKLPKKAEIFFKKTLEELLQLGEKNEL